MIFKMISCVIYQNLNNANLSLLMQLTILKSMNIKSKNLNHNYKSTKMMNNNNTKICIENKKLLFRINNLKS